MSKQINIDEALCYGMDTNLFYMFEEDLAVIGKSLLEMRKVCFACPIMKECMEYGFRREKYGMFGGITGEERELMRNRAWTNAKMVKFITDINEAGVSINEFLEFVNVERNYL